MDCLLMFLPRLAGIVDYYMAMQLSFLFRSVHTHWLIPPVRICCFYDFVTSLVRTTRKQTSPSKFIFVNFNKLDDSDPHS
jgi:hypothetical protein